MSENRVNYDYYGDLSDDNKTVCIKIEQLLSGLSVATSEYLLMKVKRSIQDNSMVLSS